MSLRRIPIYRALDRPHLLLGGERTLVLMSILLCALMGLTAVSFWMVGVALGLWVLLQLGFIGMAKMDAHFSEVYVRQLKYSAYYPPHSGIDAPILTIHDWKN